MAEQTVPAINNEFIFYNIHKLQDIIEKIEDKIIIYDNRFNDIFNMIDDFNNMNSRQNDSLKFIDNEIHKTNEKVKTLKEHKNRQIDENRKISRRVDEVELLLNALKETYNSMCKPSLREEPFICPVCKGKGLLKDEIENKILKFYSCTPCEGKGIVWG